jgi:hypothetical protein
MYSLTYRYIRTSSFNIYICSGQINFLSRCVREATCIFIYINIYMNICIYTCIHTYKCIRYIYMYIYLFIYTYIYKYVHIYLCSGQINFLSGCVREATHCNVVVGYFESVKLTHIKSSTKIRLKDIINARIVCF